MWIHFERAEIDGKEIYKDSEDWENLLEVMAKRIDVLKLDPKDDVIGRAKEEFEKEYPIPCGDALLDYLFTNYQYYHHTKSRKATFRQSGIILELTFS